MEEFYSLLELLTMLIKEPRYSILLALLVTASISDYLFYKIPNWLTAGGIVFGLIYNAVFPFSLQHGFLWALGGCAIGFAIMLPCYVLRIMGAGDVKLMAMVGAFLGVSDTLHAILYTFIVGGISALAFSLFNRTLVRMLDNVRNMTQTMMVSAMVGFKPDVRIAPGTSVGKLPYGICISIGTVGYVVAKQLGYA